MYICESICTCLSLPLSPHPLAYPHRHRPLALPPLFLLAALRTTAPFATYDSITFMRPSVGCVPCVGSGSRWDVPTSRSILPSP